MITEDYISFETAKLLKDKGFDEYCGYYSSDGEYWGYCVYNHKGKDYISAPTLQMAMKWLKENYCLYIDIELLSGPSFSWYIWFMNDPQNMMGCSEDTMHYYDTYEEAAEAAIKYCLENLI